VGAYICHGAVPTSREPCSAAQCRERGGACVPMIAVVCGGDFAGVRSGLDMNWNPRV
jgi:hypothetical protein